MKSRKVYCVINPSLDGFLQPNPVNGVPKWGKLFTAELFTKRDATVLAKFFGGSESVSMYAAIGGDNE